MTVPSFCRVVLSKAVGAAFALSLTWPLVAPADDVARFVDCRGCLTSEQIGDGSITVHDIRDGTITGRKIRNGSITGLDIRNGSVGSFDIRDNSIRGRDIRDGTITSADILDEPGIDFDHRSLRVTWNVFRDWRDMATVKVDHRASGYVNCTGTGTFIWLTTSAVQAEIGWAKSGSTPHNRVFAKPVSSASGSPKIPVATALVARVVGAGPSTFKLRTRVSTGGVAQVQYQSASATCMYFPSRL